ncbi:MAG: carbohydrate ABC transporter substrate-binding protein [Clostridia bacterium]|nr:carbohydrate ABC transporter substrate-binding protein [Clostridia bacterium]
MKKTIISWLLALALFAGMIPAALASTGDATVYYAAPEDGMGYYSVESCMLAGNKVYYYTGNKLYVYDIATQQTEEFDASALLEDAEGRESAEDGAPEPYSEIAAWFVKDGEVFALINKGEYAGDGRTVEGGYINRLTLADGAAALESADMPRLDWSGMIETYDEYSYSRWAQDSFCSGDSLFIQTYDDEGNDLVMQFDLTDGQAREHYIQDLNSIAPAGDGRLLVCLWGDEELARIGFYDPASESVDIRAEYKVVDYMLPQNMCYSAENDTVYYVFSGEIWAAPGFDFDNAVSVNDCPAGGVGKAAQMTDDGFLLLYDYETVVLRNTDPAQRSEITLYVKNYSYVSAIDKAYYDYTNRRGDISMVISSNGQPGDILQAMMNRDGSVDIYCMDMSLSQYSAVFERGYMAELDGSAKLTAAVDSMYPAIAEAVKKDGVLYAIPLGAYGYGMGVNTTALEKLGLTMDDMPKTWDGFFDFLAELPEKLEGSEVRAFDSWYEQRDLRMQLFNTLLMSYQNYINAGEAEYAFNTPLLNGLMARIDEIDMGALDVVESNYDEETDTWYDNYDDRTALFTDSVSTVIQSYNEGEPLLLTFGDEAPRASIYLRVAFVNPFSAHVAESVEFLETLIDDLDMQAQYAFYPDRDEPIRYPDFEEYKVSLAQWLEEAREALEKAGEDEKEDYEDTVRYLEENLATIDDTYWMFSPQAIESYKARVQYLSPVTYDFTSELTYDENDSFYSLFQRFYEGNVSASELLAGIDKKVQMMRLEGM